MKKKLLSLICAAVLLLGLTAVPAQAAEASVAMSAQGWYETICAELTGVADSAVTAVSYTDADGVETALTGDDFTYLVRDMDGGGVRIDIPGVKAGTYSLSVTAGGVTYTALNIGVKAYDRSGFAHKAHTTDESGAITGIVNYTEGVGAYNDDGTLKENATVLYVTEENKEDVTLTVTNNGAEITVTGIGNILNCKGYDQNLKASGGSAAVNAYGKILAKMASAQRPIVVRIIGEVTKPQGVTDFNSTGNGGSVGDNGGMCIMQYVGNITIEGVGSDATVNGWGFSFSADGTGRTVEKNTKRDGWGENIEVRNLTFRNVPEDCIGINGSQDSSDGFKDSAEHIWVHNNAFYGPTGLPDASSEGDKSEGDGAVDFRNGEYMTLSYNYFEGYHKTSLIGSGDSTLQYHVTWHHNWWKNVQSRSPLCRQADVHIYNNLYDGQTSYCMSLRANCYIFSEYNTFLSCKNPVVDEGTGGVCKSYQDVFKDCNCVKPNAAQIKTDRSETVTSANLYANFDTDAALSYIPAGDYALQTDAAEAAATVRAEAGVQKRALDVTGYSTAAYGALGTLTWVYTNEGDVIIPGGVPDGATILVAGYADGGRCVKTAELVNGKADLGAGMAQGKLFWLDAQLAPQCPAGGWGEVRR